MKKKIADMWIAALESGEFKQTKDRLEDEEGNCCLGVLCNLALVEGICDYEDRNYYNLNNCFDGKWDSPPESVREWAGLKTSKGEVSGSISLITMNDIKGYTFKQIAKHIRKNWREL